MEHARSQRCRRQPRPKRARAVARGKTLFNTKPIRSPASRASTMISASRLHGTCTTCHDTPNAGNHSSRRRSTSASPTRRAARPTCRSTRCATRAAGETVQTTDPGRALITGKWKDIGTVQGTRPARTGQRGRRTSTTARRADLAAVVDFYDERFGIGFHRREGGPGCVLVEPVGHGSPQHLRLARAEKWGGQSRTCIPSY